MSYFLYRSQNSKWVRTDRSGTKRILRLVTDDGEDGGGGGGGDDGGGDDSGPPPVENVHYIHIVIHDNSDVAQSPEIDMDDTGILGGGAYAGGGGSSPSCFPVGGTWLVYTGPDTGWFKSTDGDASHFPPSGSTWVRDNSNSPEFADDGFYAVVTITG